MPGYFGSLDAGGRLGDTVRMSATPEERGSSSPVRSLVTGILLFRWVWLAWMCALAWIGRDGFTRPLLAGASVALAIVWTAWLTVARPEWDRPVLIADLAICGWLILASGLVVADGEVVSGRPFFATGYPLSAALVWGASTGVRRGSVAGLVLGLAHLLSRPLNGVDLGELGISDVQNLTGAVLNYLVAGSATGFVRKLLGRSAEAVEAATDDLVRERELSARLAERESLARAIHDSVLQALALVHKRGRELARATPVDPAEVGKLAEMAGRQEAELRALILRPLRPEPVGRSSLRSALEKMSREIDGVVVTVSVVDDVFMPAGAVAELAAAARQALENVARHSEAPRATVFADDEGGAVTLSVKDDGKGFTYDEQELQRQGKVGILKSMKGRIEDLGGRVTIESAPGKGTEVEFWVPLAEAK